VTGTVFRDDNGVVVTNPDSTSTTLSSCAARTENRRDVTPGRSRPVTVTSSVICGLDMALPTLPTRGHYISQTGRAEAEKVRLMGEAQGVAYHEQVNALGAQGVALVEVLKVIGEKGVRITPDIMASGGGADGGGGGGIGTLLLLNLFRNQMNLPPANGDKG